MQCLGGGGNWAAADAQLARSLGMPCMLLGQGSGLKLHTTYGRENKQGTRAVEM